MALITCQECGHQVSDRAAACPKCGCPLVSSAAPVASPSGTIKGGLGDASPIGEQVIVAVPGSLVTNAERRKGTLSLDRKHIWFVAHDDPSASKIRLGKRSVLADSDAGRFRLISASYVLGCFVRRRRFPPPLVFEPESAEHGIGFLRRMEECLKGSDRGSFLFVAGLVVLGCIWYATQPAAPIALFLADLLLASVAIGLLVRRMRTSLTNRLRLPIAYYRSKTTMVSCLVVLAAASLSLYPAGTGIAQQVEAYSARLAAARAEKERLAELARQDEEERTREAEAAAREAKIVREQNEALARNAAAVASSIVDAAERAKTRIESRDLDAAVATIKQGREALAPFPLASTYPPDVVAAGAKLDEISALADQVSAALAAERAAASFAQEADSKAAGKNLAAADHLYRKARNTYNGIPAVATKYLAGTYDAASTDRKQETVKKRLETLRSRLLTLDDLETRLERDSEKWSNASAETGWKIEPLLFRKWDEDKDKGSMSSRLNNGLSFIVYTPDTNGVRVGISVNGPSSEVQEISAATVIAAAALERRSSIDDDGAQLLKWFFEQFKKHKRTDFEFKESLKWHHSVISIEGKQAPLLGLLVFTQIDRDYTDES